LLNAPAGALRAIARLRPGTSEPSLRATRFHRRSVGMARGLGARLSTLAHVAHLAPRPSHRPLPVALRRSLTVRLASERMLPVVAALVVLGASIVSLQPAAAQPIGDTSAGGADVRLPVGGEIVNQDRFLSMEFDGTVGGPASEVLSDTTAGPAESYADDGTIYKPVAVNTVVQDGKGLLQTYTVRSGDTLTGIASRYGVTMMTLWWANKLSSKDDLHVGQKLVIPPVNGLIVTVKDGDTLESLAAGYKIDAAGVVAANELDDPTLIIGQTLILPGAVGAPIPTPKPVARAPSGGGGSSSCNCSGPSNYSGGDFTWPVSGGGNYISQYFHYGHYGLDIAADYGSTVRAAAAGRVTFAGWKNNGGGYQVWISHGSGLYTTYNHMSSVSVSSGANVAEGQRVGRIGQSGWATGPHLHFEVWIGAIWNGGYRVNPLKYF
jgi:murein DD-endopeptidase MepM/ murein hydrolase activator NlpD